ncbi:hypothetical protein [Actinomadura sp. CNU-125]|uniref:hypothetical protein n=1 Tax=Actinomadura sp. CNU-125 TaxID=1904961 RepID=UPI0016523876|nr:hypothetical protein [Actinomadura sp. CNU-125]
MTDTLPDRPPRASLAAATVPNRWGRAPSTTTGTPADRPNRTSRIAAPVRNLPGRTPLTPTDSHRGSLALVDGRERGIPGPMAVDGADWREDA